MNKIKRELGDFNSDTSEYESVTCECGASLFKTFLPIYDERGITEEAYFCDCGIIYHWAYGNVVKKVEDGIDWLLQRAEDARNSEGSLRATKTHLRKLEEINQRYREVLEFYAEERRYDRNNDGDALIDIDDGHRARQALGDNHEPTN